MMRRATATMAAVLVVALSGCALPRFDPSPPPSYSEFLEGPGHVNPADPGLPNGGE